MTKKCKNTANENRPKTFIMNDFHVQTDDSGTHASLALFSGSRAWPGNKVTASPYPKIGSMPLWLQPALIC